MSTQFVNSTAWNGREWSRINFAAASGPSQLFIENHQAYMRRKLQPFPPMLVHLDACLTHGFIARTLRDGVASVIDPRTGERRLTSLSSKILLGEIQFIVYHFIDGPRIDLVVGYIYNCPIMLFYHDVRTALIIGDTGMMDEIDKDWICDVCLRIEIEPKDYIRSKPILWSTADLNSVGHSYWQNLTALDFFRRSGLINQIDAITPMRHDFFGFSRYMRDTGCLPIVAEGDYLHITFSDIYIRSGVRETIRALVSNPDWYDHQPADNNPLVMFQLRATKRNWKGQIDGIANCINVLSSEFAGVHFVIDGLSKLVDDQEADESAYVEENKVFDAICAQVRKGIKVDSIIGWEIPAKMARLAHMRVFCTPIGSGFIIPHWALNKRGVAYGPPAMYGWTLDHAEFCNEGLVPLAWFPPEDVDAETDERDSAFDLDWRKLKELLAQQIAIATHEQRTFWSRRVSSSE